MGVLSGILLLYAGASLFLLFLTLRHGVDRTLRADFERVEDLLTEGPDGTVRVGGHEGEADEDTRVEVRALDGAVLYRRPESGDDVLPPPPIARAEWSFSSVVLPDGTPVRVLSHTCPLSTRSVLVRIATSEQPLRAEWRELALGLSLGVPVAIALAGLGGHWLARRVLSPLDRMARTAEELTAESLGRRLSVENAHDELGRLARAFNTALARIEESFARLRRFTADVSHELRTPLTAIRSVGEVTLAENPTAECREAIGSILEEADRLTLMVDTLLALSRADAGQVRLKLEEVDLATLARDVTAHLGVLAEERDQALEVEAAGPVPVSADRLVLRQALVNLVDNAIKYSPCGSPIRVVVAGDGAEGRLEVVDKGPGIAPEHRERIFERFYRIDAGRSREQGGAGLGLCLAHWAVTVHGGRIEVVSEEGQGSAFRVVLPAGGPPAPPPSESAKPDTP